MSDTVRVAFTTLGCKLNFSETSSIAKIFEDHGYIRVEHSEKADVFVINTCSVTEFANKKSKQAIRKLIKHNPNAKIVAIGCYSQLKPNEVDTIEGIDIILGTENKFKVLDYLQLHNKTGEQIIEIEDAEKNTNFTSSYSFGDRTRSFLKVQDGCDYYCSYCTIPKARGRSRNNTVSETVEKAKEVLSRGVKEIILTGVNIGDFGKSTNETFFDLLKTLSQLDALNRLRISSIEPNLLSDEILEFSRTSNAIMPHFHIPLQCATDYLLRKMRRRYTTDLFSRKVKSIRKLVPDACIVADVIIGVPGETAEEFDKSLQFLDVLDVSYYHVFTYSEREDTLAIKMDDQVPMSVRKERSKQVQALNANKKSEFLKKHVGEKRPVLFEAKQEHNKIYGFTDNYIKVEMPYKNGVENTIVDVNLMEVLDNGNVRCELQKNRN